MRDEVLALCFRHAEALFHLIGFGVSRGVSEGGGAFICCSSPRVACCDWVGRKALWLRSCGSYATFRLKSVCLYRHTNPIVNPECVTSRCRSKSGINLSRCHATGRRMDMSESMWLFAYKHVLYDRTAVFNKLSNITLHDPHYADLFCTLEVKTGSIECWKSKHTRQAGID